MTKVRKRHCKSFTELDKLIRNDAHDGWWYVTIHIKGRKGAYWGRSVAKSKLDGTLKFPLWGDPYFERGQIAQLATEFAFNFQTPPKLKKIVAWKI